MDARAADASRTISAGVPPAGRRTSKSRGLVRLAREPIVHFVFAGAAIFALSEVVEHHTSQYRIEIGPDQIARLSSTFLQQYGSAPNESQLAALKQNYIREEIFYRESLALGLDQGDEIVRRRLAQKFEFLQQDLQALEAPEDAEIAKYFSENAAAYFVAPRRTFAHLYFSPDGQGGDAVAQQRAHEALAQLAFDPTGQRRGLGDAFAGPSDFSDLDRAGARRLFGDEGFSDDVFKAPSGQWAGPFRSGFGWHLTFVFAEKPGRQPELADVLDRVREDYRAASRAARNKETFGKIQEKYEIVDRAPVT